MCVYIKNDLIFYYNQDTSGYIQIRDIITNEEYACIKADSIIDFITSCIPLEIILNAYYDKIHFGE